ncbi:MAG: response regulator [Burkholderiales bacterium]|nr:response regulator [Burkholderiales bacterium]MDE2454004.1 response regulator [Burkholderiales bacterium]
MLRAQLRRIGSRANFAEDGAQALRAWVGGDYALLLTDCSMPGLDGFELAAAIRAREDRLGGALADEPQPQAFDDKVLKALVGDPGVVARILDTFVASAESDFAALRTACMLRDSAQVARPLHRLLGSARSEGAITVARTCEALQERANRSQWDAAAAGLDEIARAVAEFSAATDPFRRPPEATRG